MRTFKSAWFTKAARKAHITDEELCLAISQVMSGQADNLGGGVYKKCLSKNQYRSIILTKTRTFWIHEYLYAKQDRANIEDAELVEFRRLAKSYDALATQKVDWLLQNKDWVEICNGNQA